jgi:hypothetical protein
MKKTTIFFTFILFVLSFTSISAQSKFDKEKTEIGTMLDGFNVAAAKADFTLTLIILPTNLFLSGQMLQKSGTKKPL